MRNLNLNNISLFAAVLLVGGTLAGCNNEDAGAPKGLDAQKQAVIGGTPPPDVQKQIDASRAEDARKMAAGQAADQAAAKAKGDAPK